MQSHEGLIESSFTVDQRHEGKRLDAVLPQLVTGISRSQLQKGIDGGFVLVNGATPKKNLRLRAGDIVAIREGMLRDMVHPPLEAEDIPLDIIYEDEWFIAINKPAGLVVHPGSGNKRGTAVNALMHHTQSLAEGFSPDRPGIVHRIDKDTSGVLIAAKTNSAHTALAGLFARRRIEKYYLGICFGRPNHDRGSINLPVGRSTSDPLRQAVRSGGREALTEYLVLDSRSSVSAISFRLHTGRTHQIRVHCSHGRFPIVQDELYGGGRGRVSQLPPLDRAFAVQVLACFGRQALHAYRVGLRHPFTNELVTITAPLPRDFRAAFRLFGLDESDIAVPGSGRHSVVDDHPDGEDGHEGEPEIE